MFFVKKIAQFVISFFLWGFMASPVIIFHGISFVNDMNGYKKIWTTFELIVICNNSSFGSSIFLNFCIRDSFRHLEMSLSIAADWVDHSFLVFTSRAPDLVFQNWRWELKKTNSFGSETSRVLVRTCGCFACSCGGSSKRKSCLAQKDGSNEQHCHNLGTNAHSASLDQRNR